MTIASDDDQHPDALEAFDATPTTMDTPGVVHRDTKPDNAGDPAEEPVTAELELNLRRVGDSLSEYGAAALRRYLGDLDAWRQGWEITTKARLRPAPAPFPAGHLRVDLRVVATHTEPNSWRKDITEQHHSVINLEDILADAGMVAGVFQAAVAELVDIVGAPLRRRLLEAGVLELPPIPCAGQLCIGCGNHGCPRRIERLKADLAKC